MSRVLVFILLLACSVSALAGPGGLIVPGKSISDLPPYDEVHEADGSVRPRYQPILPIYDSLGDPERAHLTEVSGQGEAAGMLMAPRILTREEFGGQIVRGSRQRVRAIRAFLEDYHSGGAIYRREQIFPRGALERIVNRYGESNWQGLVPRGGINLFYGPDWVRGPDGRFYPLEDNHGPVGEAGHLDQFEKLQTLVPGYRQVNGAYAPESHAETYAGLVAHFRSQAVPAEGEIVFLEPANGGENWGRYLQYARQAGAIVIPREAGPLDPALGVDSSGVFVDLRGADGRQIRKRVGFIAGTRHVEDLEPDHWRVRESRFLRWAHQALRDPHFPIDRMKRLKALITRPHGEPIPLQMAEAEFPGHGAFPPGAKFGSTRGVVGLIDAYLAGKVALHETAGSRFVNDKEFYTYVDRLIQVYLGEEPAQPSLRTRSLLQRAPDGGEQRDVQFEREVLEHPRNYVIKAASEHMGKGVQVGRFLSSTEREVLRAQMRADPGNYVVQEYVAPSVVHGHQVDVRPFIFAGPKGEYVFPSALSRGAPLGRPKMNVAQGGLLVPNWIEPTPMESLRRCVFEAGRSRFSLHER